MRHFPPFSFFFFFNDTATTEIYTLSLHDALPISRNVDLAAVDVQNRVSQSLGRLPNEVKNTGVIITKQIGGFVFGGGGFCRERGGQNPFLEKQPGGFRKKLGESGRRGGGGNLVWGG